MKICLIHQYYKTPEEGGGIRSYYIANYLVDQGHQVNVITAYNQKTYTIIQNGNLTIHYLPVYYSNHLTFYSRIHAFIRYVWLTLRLFGKLDRPDINYIISTPLTTGLIGLYIKWKYRIPYFFEVGDIWPEAPIQLGVIKNSLLKSLAKRLEIKIYKQSRCLIALSKDIAQHIEKIVSRKVTVITNFADTDFFQPALKSDKSSSFTVGYLGTVGMANHLEYLLDVAEVCKDETNLKFQIFGSGAQWDRIKDQVEKRGLTNLTCEEAGSKLHAREIMKRLDAIFVSFKKVPVLSTGSPNKFFDGLAAGKLIIINFEGWIKELIESHTCGIYYDPEDPRQFIDKLKPFIQQPVALSEAQKNARLLALQYTPDKQLVRLNPLLDQVND